MSKLANRLDAHFVACAAAVAAGACAVNTAEAAIVHSGPVNIAIPDTIDGVYMNVVTGANGPTAVAGWDINPYSAAAGMFNLWGPTTTTWLSTSGVIGGPYNLAFGTPIGAAGAYFRPGGGVDLAPQVNLNSDQNYFGFRFTNEANANQIHFGWMQVQFGASASVRSIVGYAYESVAGGSIGAGEIPAPGSIALLAIGAVGVAGRRRK